MTIGRKPVCLSALFLYHWFVSLTCKKVSTDFYLNQLCTLRNDPSHTQNRISLTPLLSLSSSFPLSVCLSISLSVCLSHTHTHIQQSRQVPGKLVHQNSLLLFKDFFTLIVLTLLFKILYYTMGNVQCDQRRCYQSDNITSFTQFF